MCLVASGLPVYFLLINNDRVPKFLCKFEQKLTHLTQKLVLGLPETFKGEKDPKKEGVDNQGFQNETLSKKD